MSILRTDFLRATSHTRLKAHDHCILRSLIGRKDQDQPRSLHTRRWRPKGPKKPSRRKLYMDSYMAYYKNNVSWFATILVMLTFKRWIWSKFQHNISVLQPLDENQGPSKLHGHGPSLVALRACLHKSHSSWESLNSHWSRVSQALALGSHEGSSGSQPIHLQHMENSHGILTRQV